MMIKGCCPSWNIEAHYDIEVSIERGFFKILLNQEKVKRKGYNITGAGQKRNLLSRERNIAQT